MKDSNNMERSNLPKFLDLGNLNKDIMGDKMKMNIDKQPHQKSIQKKILNYEMPVDTKQVENWEEKDQKQSLSKVNFDQSTYVVVFYLYLPNKLH